MRDFVPAAWVIVTPAWVIVTNRHHTVILFSLRNYVEKVTGGLCTTSQKCT
jgi:hypothetical protein